MVFISGLQNSSSTSTFFGKKLALKTQASDHEAQKPHEAERHSPQAKK